MGEINSGGNDCGVAEAGGLGGLGGLGGEVVGARSSHRGGVEGHNGTNNFLQVKQWILDVL